MAYQTVKVRRELLEEFRLACKLRGDPINAVLRRAMEDYVEQAKRMRQDSRQQTSRERTRGNCKAPQNAIQEA